MARINNERKQQTTKKQRNTETDRQRQAHKETHKMNKGTQK